MACTFCQHDGHQRADCPQRRAALEYQRKINVAWQIEKKQLPDYARGNRKQIKAQQRRINAEALRLKCARSTVNRLVDLFRHAPFDWTLGEYQEQSYECEDPGGQFDEHGRWKRMSCSSCLLPYVMSWPEPLYRLAVIPEGLNNNLTLATPEYELSDVEANILRGMKEAQRKMAPDDLVRRLPQRAHDVLDHYFQTGSRLIILPYGIADPFAFYLMNDVQFCRPCLHALATQMISQFRAELLARLGEMLPSTLIGLVVAYSTGRMRPNLEF